MSDNWKNEFEKTIKDAARSVDSQNKQSKEPIISAPKQFKCHQCGTPIQSGAKYCSKCGNKAMSTKKVLLIAAAVFVIVFLVTLIYQFTKPSKSNYPVQGLTRENDAQTDLNELCKDWLFFRRKILESHARGDEKATNEYQAKFQRVNAWLKKYPDKDVAATISRLEAEGK